MSSYRHHHHVGGVANETPLFRRGTSLQGMMALASDGVAQTRARQWPCRRPRPGARLEGEPLRGTTKEAERREIEGGRG